MEMHQLTTEELRGYDSAKKRDTELEIRRALVAVRMDIYAARNSQSAKVRGLRRSLARLLTLNGQSAGGAVKAAAGKTPKASTKKA